VPCALRLLAGFVFWAALVGAPSAGSGQEPLNLSYSAITPTQIGIWMAQETGAFKRHGLDVKLVYIASAPTSLQALLGGSVDVAHAGSSGIVIGAAQGAPVTAIAAPQNRPVYSLWVQPEIQSLEGLKGKVLGFTRYNSSTHFVTVLVLRKFNLERDVQARPMGGVPEMQAAFAHRQVAGIITANPPQAKARLLLNVAELGIPYATGVIAVRREQLQGRRPLWKRLLRAYSEGVAEIFRDREKTTAVLAKYVRRQDPEGLAEIYDQVRSYTERVPRVDARIVDSILSVLGREKSARADAAIDNSLVEELVAEGFYAKLYGEEVR
jgi:ABC-type nitrate/sulfonate/bicarbonate transport system substrate-binding protein